MSDIPPTTPPRVEVNPPARDFLGEHLAALTTLWSSATALVLLLAVSFMFQMRGTYRVGPDGKVEVVPSPISAAEISIFAAPMVSAVALVANIALMAFARRTPRPVWFHRIPVPFRLGLDPCWGETRLVQVGFLVLALAGSLGFSAYVLAEFFRGKVYLGDNELPGNALWQWPQAGQIYTFARPKGPEVFVLWQPLIYSALALALLVTAGMALWLVTCGRRPR